jgi:hypothetical protein
MDTFMAKCCNADNCLNFIKCPDYTPQLVTVKTIGPVHYCDKFGKLVHMEPCASEDWDILQKQYMRCDGVNLDDETVLVQEGV